MKEKLKALIDSGQCRGLHKDIVLLRLAHIEMGKRFRPAPTLKEVSGMLFELGYRKHKNPMTWLAGIQYVVWVSPSLLEAKNSELKLILNETLQPTSSIQK